MYVRKDHQLPYVPAPPVIDSVETQAFPDRFIWEGTRDRTAVSGGVVAFASAYVVNLIQFCAVEDAVAFRDWIGGEDAIQNYTQASPARVVSPHP